MMVSALSTSARAGPHQSARAFRCSGPQLYIQRAAQHHPARRSTMVDRLKFYFDGAWQDPASKKTRPVINPATEEVLDEIALGSQEDVDQAVGAARRAFETYSLTTREQRIELLGKIIEAYKRRMKDIGAAISDEMGAPLSFAERFQAGAGLGHLMTTLDVLKSYPFEERLGSAMIVREPVGVVGMITPWNWPLNQILQRKVAVRPSRIRG